MERGDYRNYYKGHMDKASGGRIKGGRCDGWGGGSGESEIETTVLEQEQQNVYILGREK